MRIRVSIFNFKSLSGYICILILLAMNMILVSFIRVEYLPSAKQHAFTPTLNQEKLSFNVTTSTCNCSTTPQENVACPPSPSPIVQWYANKLWHGPNTFPLCSMDTCFNYTRCEGMSDIRIYHYGAPYGPERFFTELESSPWYTSDPNQACLFLFSMRLRKPISGLAYWNGGLNHAMVTFSDKYSLTNPDPPTLGNASIISSELHETTARAGFDISVPLPARHPAKPIMLQVPPHSRKYFLTFRGTRYLGNSDGSFRSDPSFKSMHNGKDVVVLTSCRQYTNDLMRKEDPTLGVGCDEDEIVYKSYGFSDLYNSTFMLAPAGRSPGSYRFTEALSAGAIPVLICDNYIKPFDTIIHWHQCLLQFPTTEMHRILPALRALSPQEIQKRQKYCISVYLEYMKDDASLLRATVLSLKLRFYGTLPNLTQILPSLP